MKKYITLALLLISLSLNAEVRYVSKMGTSIPPYTTWKTACDSIQKCINYCNSGDTIYIDRGRYRETLDIQNKNMTIIGVDMDECIIDGTNIPSSIGKYNMCYFKKSDVEFNGITFIFKRFDDY
ncbi:MAG TPA: pectinesterase family protein, partial [Melioribacteraceae bacterium]|nr:pectinesterase family protein [Melioribacteraceae bacterium]